MVEIESEWTARDRELKMFGGPARTFLCGGERPKHGREPGVTGARWGPRLRDSDFLGKLFSCTHVLGYDGSVLRTVLSGDFGSSTEKTNSSFGLIVDPERSRRGTPELFTSATRPVPRLSEQARKEAE